MDKSSKSEKQKYSAPAVRKTLEILELMTKSDKSFTLSEIVNKLDITTNSAFRIFKELEAKDYVVKDPSDSTYELTPKLYYLGNSIRDRLSFVKSAYPYINRISKYTKETVLLTILDDNNDTLVIDQIESCEPIKFLSTVGATYDSHCSAMGKAMLSSLNSQELDLYVKCHKMNKKTETTIDNIEALSIEMEKIRESGIAYDLEENMKGLTCVACPIYSANGKLEGAFGVSGLTFRMNRENIIDYGIFIKKEAERFSAILGYECEE